MIRTLRLMFATDLGKTFTVSLNYVKDDMTGAQIKALMEKMIDDELFIEGLAGIKGADLTARTQTVYDMNA